MKKSFVSLLTIAAITFGMASCNSSKKQDAAEQKVEGTSGSLTSWQSLLEWKMP